MTQNSIYNIAPIMDIGNIRLDGNTISSTNTNGDIGLAPDGSGTVSVTASPIVPTTDRADSLGSTTNSWDNLYCDGVTFNDGGLVLSDYVKTTTFTPVLEIQNTTGITYTTQEGKYTRIGNVVLFTIHILLSSRGTGGAPQNSSTISGLPITSDGQIAPYINWMTISGANLTAGDVPYYNISGTATQGIVRFYNGGSSNETGYSEYTNTTEIKTTGFYFA